MRNPLPIRAFRSPTIARQKSSRERSPNPNVPDERRKSPLHPSASLHVNLSPSLQPHHPIIALSAYLSDQMKANSDGAGIDSYVNKPYTREAVESATNAILPPTPGSNLAKPAPDPVLI